MTRSHFKILILLIGMAMMIQHIHVTGQSSCGIYMLSLLVSLPSTRQSCPPSQAASAITLTDTFTSNLAASMFAPGSQQLASEFNITKPIVATFTVTIYLLGFALGPVVIAPLSELYGRLWIYHCSSFFYFAFTLGCALSKNVAMFIVFRFICGCAASGPMSVGGGTVADVTSQDERGKAMALFSVGPLLGPVFISCSPLLRVRHTDGRVGDWTSGWRLRI